MYFDLDEMSSLSGQFCCLMMEKVDGVLAKHLEIACTVDWRMRQPKQLDYTYDYRMWATAYKMDTCNKCLATWERLVEALSILRVGWATVHQYRRAYRVLTFSHGWVNLLAVDHF